MQKIIALFVTIFCFFSGTAFSTNVFLKYEKDVPQIEYASRKLSEALVEKKYKVADANTNYDFLISLDVDSGQLGAETFSIIPEGKFITIYGGDNRGLIYGALALVEHLKNGVPLEDIKFENDKPRLEFRGIKFNLPWHTYRPSSALDQHYETVCDLKFWEAFLDMMVENRFNVISLWNLGRTTLCFSSEPVASS